ncbi:hypothetical protein tb265_25650 [Gemmatimonadetes bacterium T265]|nr:hypothetical protein tb265_25650 [Gemmatimonadetes bacterium T265]
MASADIPIERVSGSHTGFRLSWGAVFAGLAIATALQIVLTLFGLAFGLGSYNPGGEKALGIGTGIWAILSLLIALFLGGTTTGRLAGRLTRTDGFLHGALLWALSTLLTVYLLSRGIGAVVGTTFGIVGRVAGTAASAVASGAASAVGSGASAAAGAVANNPGALRDQFEQLLRQTGNPALQPDSLKAAAKQAGNVATNGPTDNGAAAQDIANLVQDRTRTISRDDIINIISARTGKSRAESEQLADRVTQAANDARSKLAQTAQDVKATVQEKAPQVAESAASGASTGIWLALLGMGLSLAAAVFGTQRTAPE